jgi:hypothetical protein
MSTRKRPNEMMPNLQTLERPLGNGKSLYLYPLFFGAARLGIGETEPQQEFDDVWDYRDRAAALPCVYDLGRAGRAGPLVPPSTERPTTAGRRSSQGVCPAMIERNSRF